MTHQEFSDLIEQLDYSAALSDLSKKDRDQVTELLKIGGITKTDYNSSDEDARKNFLLDRH
jgi:phosphoenolpyruvate carboxylase